MNRHAPSPANQADLEKKLRRVKRLARLLDKSFTVPGLKWKFGIDPLLGLIPGVGDVVAAAFSMSIVVTARQIGAPNGLLARMAINVVIDWLVGTIPVLGDLFDFGFKCNTRNVQLLEQWLATRRA